MIKREIIFAASLPPSNETLSLKKRPSDLNDAVKAALMDGAYDRLHPYLQTVDTKDGVMGSLMMDRAAAAMELQKWAGDTGNEIISKEHWARLDRAINTALRAIKDKNGNSIDRRTRRLVALKQRALEQRALPSSDDFASSGE